MDKIKIKYGKCYYSSLYNSISIITRNEAYDLKLPNQFKTLLKEKGCKWTTKGHLRAIVIEFTYGYKDNTHAIAIVHPRDQFSRKIGTAIVKGRISRVRGKGYNVMPKYVLITEVK